MRATTTEQENEEQTRYAPTRAVIVHANDLFAVLFRLPYHLRDDAWTRLAKRLPNNDDTQQEGK